MTAIHAGESELVPVRRNVDRPPQSRRPSLDLSFLVFLLAHVPLGLAMKASPGLATIHGLLVIAVAFFLALALPRPAPALYAICYLAASGVLWRMTAAAVPWEGAKYGLAFVSIILVYRFHRGLPRTPVLWYIALLVPGMMITIFQQPGEARYLLSFNFSGPLALACGVALFSTLRLEFHEFRRLTYVVAAPIVGMWVIAFQALLQTESFSTNSSKDAVGGFGPNQVSTVLGFGALVCIMWAIREPAKFHRFVLGAVGLTLVVQSMLTFSRGGLYNVIISMTMVAILYIRRPSRIVLGFATLAVLVMLFLPFFGQINDFTGGALLDRFQETDLTGRDDIASADLALWRAEPLTGVGMGRAKSVRISGYHQAASHTEFTRLLAEHGSLGLLALGALGVTALRNLSNRVELWEQAWSLALMVWTAAAMTNAAMRVAVISLAFAMASARLIAPDESDAPPARHRRERSRRKPGPQGAADLDAVAAPA